MSKIILLLCLTYLLSGCTLVDQFSKRVASTAAAKSQAQGTPQLAAVEATATLEYLTETPAYTASPSFADTQIAAERENNAQQLLIVEKRLAAVNLELTANADDKTQTAHKETVVAAVLQATGTQLVLSGTNDQAAREFQSVVPTIIYASTQAMYAGPKAQSEIAFNWMAGSSFVIIALVVILARLSASKTQATQDDAPVIRVQAAEKKKEPAPMPFAPIERTGEYLSPPGNHAHFFVFLLAIFSGKKGFAKTEWEGADSPYNRKTYGVVYNWLFEHKFIELPPNEKLRWTDDGEKWATGWMDRNLLLSPTQDGPTFAELSREISQAPENQGAEKGGGVVGEVVEPDEDEMEPA